MFNRHVLSFCVLLALAGCEMPDETADAPRPPEDSADLGPATQVERDPQAPATYQVALDTTQGRVVIQVDRELAPRGADRFYRLVNEGFYQDAKFFRVMPGFVVQFGMAADPAVNAKWHHNTFPDDPVMESNTEGTVTFATSGPDSRTSQIFINLGDNAAGLDRQGFAPFGRVVEGMDVVRELNAEYGEQPSQPRIAAEGNAYLNENFPNLDGITSATIIKGNGEPVGEQPATSEEQPAASAEAM